MIYDLLSEAIVLVPFALLLIGSIGLLWKAKTFPTVLQLIGAGCMFALTLMNFLRELQLKAGINLGFKAAGADKGLVPLYFLGITCFTVGYMFHAFTRQRD